MGILSSLFGIGGSKPSTKTVIQSQQIPPELAPFVKEILGEAQTLYKSELERGYDPYTGLTTAPFTPEEEAAQTALSGLVGTTAPFIQEALDVQREGAEKFTPEVAKEYMSPYQRAVTDIEKREAQRVFERDILPRFEKTAVDAGGLSGLGTRATFGRSELERNQAQLLADIEAKGLQSSFQDARQQFADQKTREQQMATNIGQAGPAFLQAGLAERGAQMGVGEQKRGLAQSELDEAYFRFLEERGFPQQTLGAYSQMVYANPLSTQPFGKTTATTETPFVSSPASQLMGLGLGGLNLYGMGGGFDPNPTGFGLGNFYRGARAAKEGGQINSRGLSGLPVVRRKVSGQTYLNTAIDKLIPLMSNLAGAVPNFRPLPSREEIRTGLRPKQAGPMDYLTRSPYDPKFHRNIHEDLQAAKKKALGTGRETRADIASKALTDIAAKRNPFYEKAIKETEVVDISGGVGGEVQKPRPPGETAIEYLTKVIGAGTKAGSEQRAEGRKERARLQEKRVGEEVAQIEKTETRSIAEADKVTQASITEATENAANILKISGLAEAEQKAITSQLKDILTTRNLLLEPAKVLATLMTAISSTKSKKGEKAFPSFTSEWGKLTEWAAKDTTGVTLRKTVEPDGSITVEYVGKDDEVLSNDSTAMKAFKAKEATALSQMLLKADEVFQAGGDPRASMAKSIAKITMNAIIPDDAIKALKLDPTNQAKIKAFNKKYKVEGLAEIILGIS
jgi:hypothetical protein